MSWVAIAASVAGIGLGLHGANKQSKDNASEQAQNVELQREQNDSAWRAYLMSRGLSPSGATAGNIPVNAPAINTRLPLWAKVDVPTGPKRWERAGAPQALRTGSFAGPVGGSTVNTNPPNSNWWAGGGNPGVPGAGVGVDPLFPEDNMGADILLR